MSWDTLAQNQLNKMKKVFLLFGCLCFTLIINAQSYRGSDADRMMYQRMQQYSRQNSSGNTYVPQRSYGNYGGSNYDSRRYNNSYGNNNYNYSNGNYGNSVNSFSKADVEKVIQGVYVNNSQLALIRLRYYGGKITHYSTSRNMLNREQWQNMYPDSPHPTNSAIDGQLAREYKYKVSVSGTNIYFNL